MNVSLTDKLEEFVNELVENGRYRSASEVVREAQLHSKPEDGKGSKKSNKK